jgi:murein DD-endopeptidase MepM/ murein hydrolase activator NlpD
MFISTLIAGAALLTSGIPTPTVSWPIAGYIHRVPVIPNPNWLPGHRGIDLVTWHSNLVFAPVSGEVTWVGKVDFETGITIQDEAGRKHTLMQVESERLEGDLVVRGELIGTVESSTHCGGKLCLHWGVREAGKYIDPRWLTEPLIFELP